MPTPRKGPTKAERNELLLRFPELLPIEDREMGDQQLFIKEILGKLVEGQSVSSDELLKMNTLQRTGYLTQAQIGAYEALNGRLERRLRREKSE